MPSKSFFDLVENLPLKETTRSSSVLQIYYPSIDFVRMSERFDFLDEWNNLGYGRITNSMDRFSLSDESLRLNDFDKVLAEFELTNGSRGVFIGVRNGKMVINREAGVLDGVEYALVENHVSNSLAVLLDIPYGFNGAVTFRVDCDEAIASAARLAKLFTQYDVPFSMAITTSNKFTPEATQLMDMVLTAGGSILSHSETHRANWGGSREDAKWESETARNKLRDVLPVGYNFDFVVSPFHQNPKFAVEGLRDAGIKGFVGGIIKNDPEYLVSRASWAQGVPGIMTHSQQCMLHGDCFHSTGLSVYKESFVNHYRTNTFFGYLDHPFSNYTYGWNNEEERLDAHEEFLKFLKSFDKVWFANLVDAMSFLWVKVNTKVWVEDDQLRWELPEHSYKNLPDLCVLWKGEKYRIPLYE